MSSESGEETSSEEMSAQAAEATLSDEQASSTMQEAEVSPEAAQESLAPQGEGRRTQLRIVRESVESLSRDVGNFRRDHEASIRRIESQVSSIRRDLSGHAKSKELATHDKGYQAANKRLEKQVTSLRNDLATLKAGIARDAERTRAKQEATLAKILSKVSQKQKVAAAKKSSGRKGKK